MSTLAGAHAVVTGAGGGIGRAIAVQLAEQGATTWLLGRSEETLRQTAAECGELGRIRRTDLTDEDDTLAFSAEVSAVDVLVHCAGVIAHGPIETAEAADLDAQYGVNVRAFYRLVQLLLPALRRGPGQIVVVNSSVVTGPSRAEFGQFAATQHALRALTDSLRQEVNGDGIRVLNIFPGRVATSRQQRLYEAEGKEYRPELLLQPEDMATMILTALTLPRTAEVTDIHIRPMLKSY